MPRILRPLAACLTWLALAPSPSLAQAVFAPDPTGAVTAAGVHDPMTLDDLRPQLAGAVAKEADPRLAVWIAMQAAGDLDGLVAATEHDLRGPAPHPSATQVWAWAQWARGTLTATALPDLPDDLAPRLDLAARAFRADRLGRDDLLADLAEATLAQDAPDYWADYDIGYAACATDRRAACLAVASRLVEAFPADFGAAFLLGGNFQDDTVLMHDWLAARPAVATAPGGALIRWMLENPDLGQVETRAVAEAWLAVAPQDPNALRRAGGRESALGRHAEALALFGREEAAHPFRYAARRVAGELAALRRFDETRATAEAWAARAIPEAERAGWAARLAVSAFAGAGEHGFAREAGLAGLAAAPSLAPLRLDLAASVATEGFPAEAVELLAPVLADEPGHLAAATATVAALDDDGRPREALAAFEAYLAAGGLPEDGLYNAAREAAGALGDPALLDNLQARALADLPQSHWLHGNFGYDLDKAGRSDAAFDAVRDAVIGAPSSAWRLARLVDYGGRAGRMPEAVALLEAVTRRYPHVEAAWAELGRATGQELTVWDAARVANPRRAFPEIRAAKAIIAATPDAWAAVQDRLATALARLEASGAPPQELAALLAEKAGQIDDAHFAGRLHDPSRVETALAELDRARTLGFAEPDYWRLRFFLLSRLGPSRDLTVAALRSAETRPDDAGAIANLFTGDVPDNMNGARAFVEYHRHVERRPRDSARLAAFAHRHDRWGGSPVVALAYAERAKRWNPDVRVQATIDSAYKTLGAYRRYYEEQYHKGFSVSESNLYISWFEAARADADRPQPTIRTLDLETMTVVLLHPDGTEGERRYHPVTGRLTGVRVGRFEAVIDYDEYGDVTRMRMGERIDIALSYGGAGPDVPRRLIVEMRQKDGPTLTYDYNDAGQPTRIEVEGVGRIFVAYDRAGDIAEVRAETPDGAEAGNEITNVVVAAFQNLQRVMAALEDIRNDRFVDLPVEDPELEALASRVEDAAYDEGVSALDYARLEMELGTLLMTRLGDLPGHADEAQMRFDSVFDMAWAQAADIAAGVEGVEAAELAAWQEIGTRAAAQWLRLARLTRPEGLPEQMWDRWTDLRTWVAALDPASPAVVGAQAEFAAEAGDHGLRLLSDAGWLRASPVMNPGHWRSHARADVFPRALVDRGLRMTDLVIRGNGDIVVGSDRGLAVFRRGFWEWFAFDRRAGAYSAALDLAEIEAHSNVTALAEDGQGRLWLGTRAGLVLVAGDYGGPATVWKPGDAGFPDGPVEALAVNGPALAIGSGGGLSLLNLDSLGLAARGTRPVEGLRAARGGFLVRGRDGLWFETGGGAARDLTDFRATDVLLSDGVLYVLAGESLLAADWPEDGVAAPPGPGAFAPVEGQETIARVDRPAGLAEIEVLPGRRALTVLTDLGGSVLGRGGFETFAEPGRDRPGGFLRAAAAEGRLALLTTDGVATMTSGQTEHFFGHRIHDLLTLPELGATFVATGYGIDVVHHDGPAQPEPFAAADARILRRAPDGALITHDGATVLRFAPGEVTAEEVFTVRQTVPDDRGQARIEDIRPTSDGSIWAVAGASAFRRAPDGSVTEFTLFDGAPGYPVWSDSLHGIEETPDGRVLLVASDDGHRAFRNRALKGGLFEFDGRGFVPATLDIAGTWFVTGLTPMPDGSAIIGTTRGFARLSGDRLTEFRLAEDKSYLALRDRHPALYLGTRGARLGDDLWLFGSAAGVVARKGETWFYPDRLNWRLPAPEQAGYGARVVHAVETDPQGRVYVATDRGLSIHDPEGAGPDAFLISEGRGDFAFTALEQGRMRAVTDVLLDALPPDSEAGKLAAAFRKSAAQIAELERQLDRALGQSAGGAAGGAAGTAEPEAAQIEKQILRARQRDLALLARLEKDNPTLFDMLQLNPIDLRAFARRLPEGVVVAQYLPAGRSLFINLVSRDGETLREVEVDPAELDRRTREVVAALSAQARGQVRGFGIDATAAGDDGSAGTDIAAAAGGGDVTKTLAWLYDRLLRPIENDLPEGAALVISPAGSLAYLPFAALVRDTGPEGVQHAVERFDIAVAPSLYALETMVGALPSAGYAQVVLGDPDGTLPAARAEAEAVAGLLEQDGLVELHIGEDASYEALEAGAGAAQYVHLATHGKLDPASPKDSYLLLAGNRRMSIPQIMTLPLAEAELVFLSACESGLGTDGLEYRTLSHAFLHAGARAVIATLWQVDDAATRSLAEAFYAERLGGHGPAAALAAAQRAMIAAGGEHAAPGYWAALTLFGAP